MNVMPIALGWKAKPFSSVTLLRGSRQQPSTVQECSPKGEFKSETRIFPDLPHSIGSYEVHACIEPVVEFILGYS